MILGTGQMAGFFIGNRRECGGGSSAEDKEACIL